MLLVPVKETGNAGEQRYREMTGRNSSADDEKDSWSSRRVLTTCEKCPHECRHDRHELHLALAGANSSPGPGARNRCNMYEGRTNSQVPGTFQTGKEVFMRLSLTVSACVLLFSYSAICADTGAGV